MMRIKTMSRIIALLALLCLITTACSDNKGKNINTSHGVQSEDTDSDLTDTESKSSKGESLSMSGNQSNASAVNNQSSQGNQSGSSSRNGASSQTSGGSKSNASANSSNQFDPNTIKVADYTTFSLDTFLTPYWSGNVVYNESLMFVKKADGSLEPAPLLYDPVKIVSVRNSALKTEYKEGVDYTVENGKIKLTAKSSIYSWTYNMYYPLGSSPLGQLFDKTGGGKILYAEGDTFSKTQIAVTYIHNSKWGGIVPKFQSSALSGTISKLKNKQNLNVVFYGDSVSTGCNASGWSVINKPPYVPTWPDMIIARLKQKYNTSAIKSVNEAVGGTTVQWGAQNAAAKVASHNPDLVFIGFGANNGGTSTAVFKSEMEKIISACRAENPKCEFILVAPLRSNPEAAGFDTTQGLFEPVMNQIAAEDGKTAVVPMFSIHEYILQSKRWYDMSGNNVNHPNDFMVRAHAMAACSLLIQ